MREMEYAKCMRAGPDRGIWRVVLSKFGAEFRPSRQIGQYKFEPANVDMRSPLAAVVARV